MKVWTFALSLVGHIAFVGAMWVGRPRVVLPAPREPEPIFFELVEEESPAAERAPASEPVCVTESDEETSPEPPPRELPSSEETPPEPRPIKPPFVSEPEPPPEPPPEPLHEPQAEQAFAAREPVAGIAEMSAENSQIPPPEPQRLAEAPAPDAEPAVGAVERTKVVSAPQALNRLVPAYPRSARRKGREGVVVIEAVVRENGAVAETEVVSSSGFRDLDGAAEKAVRNAEFAPAREDGVAVSGRIRLTFEFRLGALDGR